MKINNIDFSKFLVQFKGLDDLANYAIDNFLQCLPELLNNIHEAIKNSNSADLEIAAHSLKGAVSNFFADKVHLLSWQLEQMGHGNDLEKSEKLYTELLKETELLKKSLKQLQKERFAA